MMSIGDSFDRGALRGDPETLIGGSGFFKVNLVSIMAGPTCLGCAQPGVWGPLKAPRKPTDFRWLDMHSEQCVG